MARQVFEFTLPDRFVVGTVGEPGDRIFYLQATSQTRTVSVMLEKAQAALLAERLAELLAEAHERLGAEIPDEEDDTFIDTEPLVMPVDAEFRVAALGLMWDATSSTVVVEAAAVGPVDEDEEELTPTPAGIFGEERDVLRVRITPGAARAFIIRTIRVVNAGRPPCPWCQLPLDPEGHICPRQNGYRRAG
jgi:uncharacterized repeat protein (TIGR03847 family)